MTTDFAINGLGRVGRALLRIAHARDDLRLVAVNDPTPPESLARLVARDSVHGRFAGTVEARGRALVLDGRGVPVFSAETPGDVPWEDTGAGIVVEASGAFLDRASAAGHLRGPVERVVLSANAPDADVTVCPGIYDDAFDPSRHRIVSAASCTTNALAAVLAGLEDAVEVVRVQMSTVHGYTGNQRLLDGHHDDPTDPRRSRAAGLNVIPVATTTPDAMGRIRPDLAGRIQGMAVRVPTPAAALLDVVLELDRDVDARDLREAYRAAARGPLGRVLAVTEDELVSSDVVGAPWSAVIDLPLVSVADGRLARVVAWYDNEWGYASRLADWVARWGTETPGD